MLSEFLPARPEPAELQSAHGVACTRMQQLLDKADGAEPWLDGASGKLVSDNARVRCDPAAPRSAFAGARAQLLRLLGKTDAAWPWLNASGELVEGMLPRGHVLDMLGLQN